MEERLQKIIARAGIASRRRAEEMITSGLVSVNGQTVTELGTKADAARDHIKVSGKLVHADARPIYLLLNKPAETVSTMSDPEGRQSLQNLLHGVRERVFPMGRLEYHAAGAILLTNDGDLANTVLQSGHLPQTWKIKLQKPLTFEELEALSRATGSRITRLKGAEAAWYEVMLAESRGEQLRNRLFQTGHPVEKMKRVAIAGIELGSMAPGEYRQLNSGEVASLRRAAAGEFAAPAPSAISASPPVVPKPRRKSFEIRRNFAPREREARSGSPSRRARPGFSSRAPYRGPRHSAGPERTPRGTRRSGKGGPEFRSPRTLPGKVRTGGKPQGPRHNDRRNRINRPRPK